MATLLNDNDVRLLRELLAEHRRRKVKKGERRRPPNKGGGEDDAVIVKITADASGGGKYTGYLLSGTPTSTDSGNVSMPEGMTVASGDDTVLVINMAEDGETTHILKADSFHIGILDTTDAGLRVVYIHAEGGDCDGSAVTLAGSGATADTVSASDASDKIITRRYASRPSYYDSTAKILYGFYRDEVIACGRSISHTVETRVVIMTGGPCA